MVPALRASDISAHVVSFANVRLLVSPTSSLAVEAVADEEGTFLRATTWRRRCPLRCRPERVGNEGVGRVVEHETTVVERTHLLGIVPAHPFLYSARLRT